MEITPESNGVAPERFRRVALFALFAQVLIIITGATVRLTESGLGCSDWPNCEEDTVIPELEFHALIEYTNRVVITAIVSIATLMTVWAAWKRNPYRRDLARLSWGMVAGVLGQILLGRIVVLSDLNPWLVIGHFLLSMFLVWNALLLVHRSRIPDDLYAGATTQSHRPQAWVITSLAAVAVFTGTLVTGSGPHAGSHLDEPIERLPFEIADIARVHGISVILLLGSGVGTFIWLTRNGAPVAEVRRLQIVLAVLLAQGALGYVQYFTGVPALLVGFHIAGAISVWIAVLWFHFNSAATGVAAATRSHDRKPAMAN